MVCTYDNGDSTDTTARPTHQHWTTCAYGALVFGSCMKPHFWNRTWQILELIFFLLFASLAYKTEKTCPHSPWAVKYLTTNGWMFMSVIHNFDVGLSVLNRSFFYLSRWKNQPLHAHPVICSASIRDEGKYLAGIISCIVFIVTDPY